MRINGAHLSGIRRRPTTLLAAGSLVVVAVLGGPAGDHAAGVALAACHAPTAPAVAESGPSPAAFAAAGVEADRMIALVQAPAGSRAIPADPSGGGAVRASLVTNRLERSRSWQLPTSFETAQIWLRSYDPSAFPGDGLTMGNGPGPTSDVADRTYSDPHQGPWSAALLTVSVSRGSGDSADLHAVGLVSPLDDHPKLDATPCPRLRVLANRPCPDAPTNGVGEYRRPGVNNPDQPDLDRMLVPAGTPTGGRICFYGNAVRPSAQRVLDAPAAATIARAAREVHLDHDEYDGPTTGLATSEPGAVILALSYPGRPDVDVQAESRAGLGHVTNGHIRADGIPFGDSGFTCLLIRATPNVPPDVAKGCPAP